MKTWQTKAFWNAVIFTKLPKMVSFNIIAYLSLQVVDNKNVYKCSRLHQLIRYEKDTPWRIAISNHKIVLSSKCFAFHIFLSVSFFSFSYVYCVEYFCVYILFLRYNNYQHRKWTKITILTRKRKHVQVACQVHRCDLCKNMIRVNTGGDCQFPCNRVLRVSFRNLAYSLFYSVAVY